MENNIWKNLARSQIEYLELYSSILKEATPKRNM